MATRPRVRPSYRMVECCASGPYTNGYAAGNRPYTENRSMRSSSMSRRHSSRSVRSRGQSGHNRWGQSPRATASSRREMLKGSRARQGGNHPADDRQLFVGITDVQPQTKSAGIGQREDTRVVGIGNQRPHPYHRVGIDRPVHVRDRFRRNCAGSRITGESSGNLLRIHIQNASRSVRPANSRAATRNICTSSAAGVDETFLPQRRRQVFAAGLTGLPIGAKGQMVDDGRHTINPPPLQSRVSPAIERRPLAAVRAVRRRFPAAVPVPARRRPTAPPCGTAQS